MRIGADHVNVGRVRGPASLEDAPARPLIVVLPPCVLASGPIGHASRRIGPQLLIETQMLRSSRNRSIGAELASARMR